MGLDIRAYGSLQWAEPQPQDENIDFHRTGTLRLYPDQWSRWDNLVPGVYRAKKLMAFRAGSYSGYNRWRQTLCRGSLGVQPDDVRKSPDLWIGKPFFELINFSDCEGVIGPATSAKLYKDFSECDKNVFAPLEEGSYADWFIELYDDWGKAFRLAATNNGCVVFR